MKTQRHDQWASIARKVLKIPPKRLTRSEIESVITGLGPHFPHLTEALENLRRDVRPLKGVK